MEQKQAVLKDSSTRKTTMDEEETETVALLSLGVVALTAIGGYIISCSTIRLQEKNSRFHGFLFALRWQVVSCFTLVFSIFRLRFARLNHQFIAPVSARSQWQMELCARRVQNTFRHLVPNVVGQLILSSYLSPQGLRLIPGLVLLFVSGRILFFLGYPDYPQLGSLVTFLPTLTIYLLNTYFMMIMIIGLPGAGKTTYGINMQKGHPEKRYNIIGTDTLIDKMRVMGLPRRRNYHGRWDVLIDKATKCLNTLFQIASKRNRNYILDQTNVYPSAQRRKMGYFQGFYRKAAVLVPEDKELIRRSIKRTEEDGKFVPEEAVLEMKKNFQLPDPNSSLFDEINFVELPQEVASGLVIQHNIFM